MHYLLLFSFLMISSEAIKTDNQAYMLFNSKGKESSYKNLVKEAEKVDVILFGELHNNPISHWLQLELTQKLHELKGANLVLGGEMFETDNQIIINEYLSGKVTEKTFKAEAKLWPNYTTDYKPLMDFAKDSSIRFIATNIPRRYANMVYTKGLDGLNDIDEKALQWIAPLPFPYDAELPGYKTIKEMAGGHGGDNLPLSQAIKDATMAHFIVSNYVSGLTFIHYNGSYHSDNYEGIYWYLKKYKPELKILTIASVEQADIKELNEKNIGVADFIICVPENMTKTH
jgi:uncharacterized iron-regulated protein